MFRRFTASLAAGTLALSLAAIHAARPAPPQDSPAQRPAFRTDINLVLVDVHVSRAGRPVPDLTAADFRVRENGVLQQVATFEYVPVATGSPVTNIEPSNIAASLDRAADPRRRVFVLVLDDLHVTEGHSLLTREALLNFVDRLVDPADLIGIMTPGMAASELTLGQKTDVIRRGLLDNPRWGRKVETCRDTHVLDETETAYAICYYPPAERCDIPGLAMELIRLRRSAFTLGALRDAVRYIGSGREARTVFVLVSEGWSLERPRQMLTNAAASKPPQIRIGPGGRLGTQNPGNFNIDEGLCERHLRAAAFLEPDRLFRDLIDEANRYNASVYVVDPGGLRVEVGHENVLRTLAGNTGGEIVVNTNDLRGALERAIGSLSGYYLLGYYSSNSAADGRYRTIRVDVSRQDVDVRARHGYRAYTSEEVRTIAAARAAADAPVDVAVKERTAALERLARLNPSTRLFLHGAVDAARSTLYVIGELASVTASSPEWRAGGDAQIVVTAPDGSTAGTARAAIAAGARAFFAAVRLEGAAPGDYDIAVRLRGTQAPEPLLDTVRVRGDRAIVGEALAFRSEDRAQPVASFLWSRSERVYLEAPVAAGAANPAARLLDRMGQPIAVPVDVSIRDGAGGRWLVADLRAAPLSPGDYLVELSVSAGGATAQRLVPMRVGR